MTTLLTILAQALDAPSQGAPIAVMILFFLIGIAVFAFWLWTLIDCLKNETSEGNDKLIWILVIVLAGWVGSLIYLLVRRPQRKAALGK
ncbi:MAG: PLDc N-terminal domain-containing protein [Roseibacillus sp.]